MSARTQATRGVQKTLVFVDKLHADEDLTADWISRLIGEQEIDQYTRSQTYSNQSGPSSTTNHQIVTRRAVLPSELMSVDPCTREDGLTGHFMVRSAGCYKTTLDGDELSDEALIPPDPDLPEFVPRPVETQFIQPCTPERAARFGVPPRKTHEKKRRQ